MSVPWNRVRHHGSTPPRKQCTPGASWGSRGIIAPRGQSRAGFSEQQTEQISQRIAERLRPILDDQRLERLDAISGVNRTTIENVVAEIGADMSPFPDEHHLSSWAGISPGNEESAGKRLRNRTKRKNRWLRRAIIEAAWAAGRTKNSYLGAQYRRLAARRGKKRRSSR